MCCALYVMVRLDHLMRLWSMGSKCFRTERSMGKGEISGFKKEWMELWALSWAGTGGGSMGVRGIRIYRWNDSVQWVPLSSMGWLFGKSRLIPLPSGDFLGLNRRTWAHLQLQQHCAQSTWQKAVVIMKCLSGTDAWTAHNITSYSWLPIQVQVEDGELDVVCRTQNHSSVSRDLKLSNVTYFPFLFIYLYSTLFHK